MSNHSNRQLSLPVELVFIGSALLLLVAAELMLSGAMHGTTYRGSDGGMVQASVFAALRFGGVSTSRTSIPCKGLVRNFCRRMPGPILLFGHSLLSREKPRPIYPPRLHWRAMRFAAMS
jgi:hypothetical protein